jgi:hypothetical protein
MMLTTNRIILRAMPGTALGLRSRFQSCSADSRTHQTSSRAKESPQRSASSATFVTGKMTSSASRSRMKDSCCSIGVGYGLDYGFTGVLAAGLQRQDVVEGELRLLGVSGVRGGTRYGMRISSTRVVTVRCTATSQRLRARACGQRAEISPPPPTGANWGDDG